MGGPGSGRKKGSKNGLGITKRDIHPSKKQSESTKAKRYDNYKKKLEEAKKAGTFKNGRWGG
jgi:hypothetical protein